VKYGATFLRLPHVTCSCCCDVQISIYMYEDNIRIALYIP
jgi:hypothetical protein